MKPYDFPAYTIFPLRYWIGGVGPEDAGEVVHRDPDAPAVRRTPDDQDAEREERQQAERVVRAAEADIDQDDDRANRNPIADDRECPRVAGIALVDQTADGAPFEVVCPSLKQRALSAVRTTFGEAAAKRRHDQMTAHTVYETDVSVISKTSVALAGMAALGLVAP